MATGSLLLPPGYHPLIDGAVVPSGKLQFYRTGTTTPQDTYSDSTLTTPNANPIVLNATGGLDTLVYGDPGGYNYRMRVLSSADAVLDTHDDIVLDSAVTSFDISTDVEPGFSIYSNYATASRQANLTVTTYGVSGGGTVHVNHANGTPTSPTQTLSGDITGGIGSRAYTSGSAFQASSPASIHWQATENQTGSAYGMWIRFLTTPKTSTTRVERGGITDNGTFWSHDAETYSAVSSSQTLPVSDARFVASATAPTTGASYVAIGYGSGVTPGFRGASTRGTAASPTASQSGDTLAFLGAHGFGATVLSTAAKALLAFKAAENWTDSAQGTSASLELTPTGSTTRAEIARFDMSTTATHTRFMIYDVDNGTLERVTVGAADSGGAGFKVLRIPN